MGCKQAQPKQGSRDMGPGSEPSLHTQRSLTYTTAPSASSPAHCLPSDLRLRFHALVLSLYPFVTSASGLCQETGLEEQ